MVQKLRILLLQIIVILQVKALKELSFNSSNITAIMTSRQFQVMVDIISNLLLARLPKPRRYFSLHGGDEEEDAEEETDEVVPDGVPEVELARIKLEEAERALKLLAADLKVVNQGFSAIKDETDEEKTEIEPWMMHCGNRTLASRLSEEWTIKLKARKLAARSLRIALQRAAQQRFKEKEKTKSIPSAMRISWAIDKIVWSMLFDGQTFAEAEISSMNLNVDRDFHEVGIAQLTAKHFVVKNCLPHAKSNTVLSAWNPPIEWGRNSMLRVDAKQGAPKEGNSPLELFQVEIYPLRIHLTERMYRMMWDYFFPKEDRDTQRRQVWQASTTAVVKRGKKTPSGSNEVPSSLVFKREHMPTKGSGTLPSILPSGIQPQLKGEEWQGVDFRLTAQILEKDMKMASTRGAKFSGLQRTSSLDANKEDNADNSSILETVQNADASLALSLSRNIQCAQPEQVETVQQNSLITIGPIDNGLPKSRDTFRVNRSHKLSRDDKKLVKSSSQDEKKSSTHSRTNLELHNIRISQVELLVTYEGSRLSVNELRLLMDTFTRIEFTGTWRRFFSRVKKHIIWSVLKSVAGMQGKKFKDKLQSQGQVDGGGYPGDESGSSDSDGSNVGAYEQFFPSKFKRPTDRAGEGFVSSIRGLFNSQRKRAKAVLVRTKRGDGEATDGGWTEGEAENAPFTRQLSISKAKRLLRRHTKKFLSSTRHRGARANFISLELASKLGIRAEEMGMTGEAGLACPGHSEAVTPILEKLRLLIQSYVDAEEFHIMPLQDCDVLLGIPWCYRLHVVDTFHKKITLVHRGKTHVLDVKLKGESVPVVSASAISSVIKNHLSAYLVFAKEVHEVESNLSKLDKDRAAFLNGFSDCFSDSLPDELPPERPEDHRIDVVPGSSPLNRPP
ncbi:hypothetical protein L7F22_048232 [Adiantum nelumboides]|nr:hypothetical protein [Adiantum nelumboides]